MDEARLVRRAQDGDREAFREIVDSHKKNVYWLALSYTRNHHDAEDLVQEVFLRAYRSIRRFRGDAKIGSWLYRITLNGCRDWGRRRPRHATEDDMVCAELPAEGLEADPERSAASVALRAHIDRAVTRLTARERAVFVLRHERGLSTRETADVLERAEGTVKNLLFKALNKLRHDLTEVRQSFGEGA
jgi:RNA polymerase sigma-70 factor (ECF subfamily)